MSKGKVDILQKGEREFIDSVVKAVVSKDLSKRHYLLDVKGIMKYESVKADVDVEFRYENGERVKMVCIFGKELIEDFHYKAGNDDLTIPWTRRSVKSVIDHGKVVASNLEW